MCLKCHSGRPVRWVLQFQKFKVKIVHIYVKTNVIDDVLSCSPCDHISKTFCDIFTIMVDLSSRMPTDLHFEQMN